MEAQLAKPSAVGVKEGLGVAMFPMTAMSAIARDDGDL